MEINIIPDFLYLSCPNLTIAENKTRCGWWIIKSIKCHN